LPVPVRWLVEVDTRTAAAEGAAKVAAVVVLASSWVVVAVSLSDVKDALDNMNAINQYYVHMHLLVL
jgi:hypothetical protein